MRYLLRCHVVEIYMQEYIVVMDDNAPGDSPQKGIY